MLRQGNVTIAHDPDTWRPVFWGGRGSPGAPLTQSRAIGL
jgi:hypothetical protein